MTGRRNRAPKPHGSSPRAPLFHWLFIWIKKLDTEDFRLQQTAARFSANIIWLLFYLFAGSSCLWGTCSFGFFEAEPSQGSGGGGGEKPDFLRSKNVALCLFTSKAMAVLRWFLPRENNCIIERAIKLKILAVLFVCENFLLTGRRGRRPLQSCVDNLPKFKVFAVLFRYKHSGAVHQTKGGGNRLKTVGLDNGLDVQKGRAGRVKYLLSLIYPNFPHYPNYLHSLNSPRYPRFPAYGADILRLLSA